MPSIYRTPDGGAIIFITPQEMGQTESLYGFASLAGPAFDAAWRKIHNRPSGIEDVTSRNKSLAPRKPAQRRAKGQPSKGVKQARKDAGKKRGR